MKTSGTLRAGGTPAPLLLPHTGPGTRFLATRRTRIAGPASRPPAKRRRLTIATGFPLQTKRPGRGSARPGRRRIDVSRSHLLRHDFPVDVELDLPFLRKIRHDLHDPVDRARLGPLEFHG